MIVLDTNICIAHLNEVAPVTEKLLANIGQCALPMPVVSELVYGFNKSARASANLPRLYQFFQTVVLLPLDFKSAEVAAQIRLQLEQIGKPTGSIDLLIAAITIRHDATLVTHNTKHFQHIPGIKLDDWLT